MGYMKSYLGNTPRDVVNGAKFFWENEQEITRDYTIDADKNAMSAGPITIGSGVTVTVEPGATWTVV